MKVDVIVTAGTPATRAAQKATSTIPIVFGSTGDPVGSGIASNLAHPGGNITGLSAVTSDFAPKHLEMLLSMVPKLSRVAVLMHPASPVHPLIVKELQAAMLKAGVKILPAKARTPQEIDIAFSTIARENAGAVIVLADTLFTQQHRQIARLAAKNRLPSIASIREFPEVGGLMSYGPNFADMYRRAATYVDKIFKGAKPSDLPVEQPTTFELVINRKTAKALGLAIPESLLISANKVIG
jgi:putative ABC transport system substrate-binding protein